jgi:hypothetical protein
MHFDLTNFLSGLAGALVGGVVLWVFAAIRAGRTHDDYGSRRQRKPWNPSVLLGVAFVIGILIGLYLLITGQLK